MARGMISVTNGHLFTDLNAYDFRWVLTRNGEQESEGRAQIQAAPGETVQTDLSGAYPKLVASGDEYVLTLSMGLREPTLWAAVLPLNAVTSLLGAPLIGYLLLRRPAEMGGRGD